MERIRWSERSIPFRNVIDNPSIRKPTLVQLGNKAIVVGEKINGEFIMASPCKVSGDRFDVLEEEIVLSSKHTGVWRVISKSTSNKEGHIHRLTTKDLERIHKQDVRNERTTPRAYICIRDIEAFELVVHSADSSIASGTRIERRMKHIEEDTEFEIYDTGEVEYTPTEGERTSQDYTMVPKVKQGTFLQLLLPGVVEQEQALRNRIVRALHCKTKSDTRKRHFFIEVNEQPCEIRPIASEGSTELRYLHSTQNLYDYMLTYGNDTSLFVKLLRGDPPVKAIEFDGYMVLKTTLNGDKIPICRVEDLEITLVSPDLPVKVRLPTKNEQVWRSLSEVRVAEVQCMQLALALLARHESEMYITIGADNNSTNSHQERQSQRTHQLSDARRKHLEECQKVFGSTNNNGKMKVDDDMYSYESRERQQQQQQVRHTSTRASDEAVRLSKPASHLTSDRLYRTKHDEYEEQDDSYNRSHRSSGINHSKTFSSNKSKTRTYLNSK